MKPIPRFLNRPKSFWASVRSLSQKVGYSKKDMIVVPTVEQMAAAFDKLGLDSQSLFLEGRPTPFAIDLLDYFNERSRVLMNEVKPKLLNAEQAKDLFLCTRAEFDHKCPIPMNKQKGEKRAEAFLTAREYPKLCVWRLAHAVFTAHLLNRSGYRIANWFLAATHSLTQRPAFSKLRMAK